MCDRLYFDELTFERVMDIIDLENPHGVIVSTGGQIPNNLAMRLDGQCVPILGTTAQKIDNAEDRAKFSEMLSRNGIDQPEWSALTSMDDINKFIDLVGFPVLASFICALRCSDECMLKIRRNLNDSLSWQRMFQRHIPLLSAVSSNMPRRLRWMPLPVTVRSLLMLSVSILNSLVFTQGMPSVPTSEAVL